MWITRVHSTNENYVHLVVPACKHDNVIVKAFDKLPEVIINKIKSEQKRFHAKVNLNAEHELFFEDWEEE